MIEQKEIKSPRTLTENEEMAIYKIAKTYGYRYWGGGSIMVDSDGVSCLNIGFETRAATISTKLGTQLRKLFEVEEVRVEGVKL